MNNDFTLLLPEFLVTALAFLALSADFVTPTDRKHWLGYLSAIGLAIILCFTLWFLWGKDDGLYDGAVRVDDYSLFFKGFFLALAIVVVLSSVEYVRLHLDHAGEYYGILLFTVVAAMVLSSSGELLTAYISLELLSFGLYALVGFDRYNAKSNESGMKYILLGALSSAFLLYGISQIYGYLGTTYFEGISQAIMDGGTLSPGLFVGVALIIAGIGFKVAAVPFHMWAPDVYEGAPTPITAYLAVGSKAAAFAMFMRLFAEGFVYAAADWRLLIIILAAATMTLGNLIAIAQTNIKRMLAYSSVGHVGYLLMGIAALVDPGQGAGLAFDRSHLASNAIMLHLAAYGATNMAAFLAVGAVSHTLGGEAIRNFAGIGKRAPGLSMVLAASLFSLAGLPIFAGFTSKFYLFTATAAQGLLWLAGLAILMSLVSLYYYLMVIRQIYIENAADPTPIRVPRLTTALLGALLLGMILMGVYPAPLMEFIQSASETLFSIQ